MRRYDIEMQLYNEMCASCPYAKKCHEDCENCDDFEEELERRMKDE